MSSSDSKEETKGLNKERIVMYLFVNNDLKMGKGKIAGQVGHAVQHLIQHLVVSPTPEYIEWTRGGLSTKIVCKATQEQLGELITKWYETKGMYMEVIFDAGKSQITAGSMTVIGFSPKYQRDIPKEWSGFPLL